MKHKNIGFVVSQLWRMRSHDKKGKHKSSVIYDTSIEAENNAFKFRCNYENKACNKHIGEYESNLVLILAGSNTNPISKISSTQKTKLMSPSTIKSYYMSSSHQLNRRVQKSTNPNNCTPSSSISNYPTHAKFAASKIQRLVKNRDIRHSVKKTKETIKNQAYRCGLIKHFSKFINTNTCKLLLLGSEDPEICKTYSPFDKRHATLKDQHITDALIILHRDTVNKTAINWIQCCELAVEIFYNTIKRTLIVADWYYELHQTDKLQFRRSQRGQESFAARSPFSEDESLLVQSKSWARQDIEHLNVQKEKDFISTKLLSTWSVEQLRINKIAYPVSDYICTRWMKEAGFKYERHNILLC